MEHCDECGAATRPHCDPECPRGWVRCTRCRAFGVPAGRMAKPIIPIDLEPEA